MLARRFTHRKYILLALVLLAVLSLSSAVAVPVWALTSAAPGDVAAPVRAQLKMDKLPLLGQPAQLSCVASTVRPALNATVDLILPEGAQLVTGTGHWTGSLKPGAPVTLTATVAFNKAGPAQVSCSVRNPVNAHDTWANKGNLYMTVGQTMSKVGWDTRNHSQAIYDGAVPMELDEAALQANDGPAADGPSVDLAFDETASAAPEVPAGYLTVTGTWKYTDRAGTLVGAKVFKVKVVNATTYAILKECYTNATGYFSCGPFTNPGSAGFSVRIYSYVNYAPYGDVLMVTDGTGSAWSDVYFVYTAKKTYYGSTYAYGNLYVANGGAEQHAFWIKDDIDRAFRFVNTYAGSDESPVETAGGTTVYWWPTNTTDGTHYHLGGVINLLGGDELSHDIVIHEYAHNIMYRVYGNTWPPTSCPDPHYLFSNEDTGCAWTEGWADFFPLAVNNDPLWHWNLVDTTDMENKNWTDGYDQGYDVEGRVAGALWDIMDSGNDGTDTYNGVFDDIWQVLYHQNDNTFRDYFLAWLSPYGHNYSGAVMSIYQNTIDFRRPVAPALVSPADGASTTAHTVLLDWNSASRATSYKVEVRYGSTTGTVMANLSTGTATQYSKYYSTHGAYYWRALACNAFGCVASGWRHFHVN